MKTNKRILVCPLDWGLGHASRCVPIIDKLIQQDFEVILAADNQPLALLRQEFPQLQWVQFSSYTVRYGKGKSQVLKMLLQAPALIWSIWKEHNALKQIVLANNIDIVISDNRFGLWNKQCFSIFITHQINIKMPRKFKKLEHFVNRINKWFISRYNRCWIPDLEGIHNFSGELSHIKKTPSNCFYIGTLSHFSKNQKNNFQETEKYQLVAVLSGPEPQRTILEQIILEQAKASHIKTLIIQGKINSTPVITEEKNVKLISFLTANEIRTILLDAENIICRSGYSSIMDLLELQRKAILVPTPGQTEQEYLAKLHASTGYFYTILQDKLNLQNALVELKKISHPIENKKTDLLDMEISFLKSF